MCSYVNIFMTETSIKKMCSVVKGKTTPCEQKYMQIVGSPQQSPASLWFHLSISSVFSSVFSSVSS